MLFAVCCDRGSPGSTSTALALAAACGLPAVVVEADPYGGDLALRCRIGGHPLPPTPTVLALGAGRAGHRPQHEQRADAPHAQRRRHLDLRHEGAHQLNRLTRVVPGVLSAEQAATLAWPVVTTTLERQTIPVFADLGRIHAASPSMSLACAADALIVVCRGDMASVQHMLWRLEHLVPEVAQRNGRPPRVIAVVIAERRHGAPAAKQIADLLGDTAAAPTVAGTGWLAWDSVSVTRLAEGADPEAKPLRGSPLMKSARRIVGLLSVATGLEYRSPDAASTSQSGRDRHPVEHREPAATLQSRLLGDRRAEAREGRAPAGDDEPARVDDGVGPSFDGLRDGPRGTPHEGEAG